MTEPGSRASTRNSKLIHAPADVIYRAFTDPDSLAHWQAPDEMTATVHEFTLEVGGGYTMSLYYPADDTATRGKTKDREDRYTSRFVVLEPSIRIVEAIVFDTNDPAFQGEMMMAVTLEPESAGTRVTVEFNNIPPGIRPEDNEAGTESSLEKLARYVEQGIR